MKCKINYFVSIPYLFVNWWLCVGPHLRIPVVEMKLHTIELKLRDSIRVRNFIPGLLLFFKTGVILGVIIKWTTYRVQIILFLIFT